MGPWRRSISAGLLAAAMLAGGCLGPFNLTKRLYQWNTQVGTKWESEFMFLLLVLVPAYGLATVGDAVIFNSMEFWTGSNPVDPPQASAPRTKRLARGETEAVLTYVPLSDGAELFIDRFQRGRPAGGLRLRREAGVSSARDRDGRLLATAATLADGSVLVRDAGGKQMASYSADQVDRLLGASQR